MPRGLAQVAEDRAMTRLAYVMSTSFVILAIAGRSFLPITPKLIWNASASAPIGLYAVRSAADLGVTDLVAVDAPEPLAGFLSRRQNPPPGVPPMNRIPALPAQTLCPLPPPLTLHPPPLRSALAPQHPAP